MFKSNHIKQRENYFHFNLICQSCYLFYLHSRRHWSLLDIYTWSRSFRKQRGISRHADTETLHMDSSGKKREKKRICSLVSKIWAAHLLKKFFSPVKEYWELKFLKVEYIYSRYLPRDRRNETPDWVQSCQKSCIYLWPGADTTSFRWCHV